MSTEIKESEVVQPEKKVSGADIEIVPWSDAHVFSPKEVSDRVKAIHKIMKTLMRPDVHYGTIPGTQKPTLFKPGAEVLLLTFRIAIEPEITDLSTRDEVRYRVRAFGRHVPTGALAGIGVGECSSKEEKFLWREAICREEYEGTPEDQRRIKYKRKWDNGRPSAIKIEQIKVQPADAANAVLKRAKKRAQVDFCLTAMAASDIFTQDVEDLPDGYLTNNDRSRSESRSDTKRPVSQPRPTPTAQKNAQRANGGQAERVQLEPAGPGDERIDGNAIKGLTKSMEHATLGMSDFKTRFPRLAGLEQVKKSDIRVVLSWIANPVER
jgi:hypothetical protein